MRKVLYLLIILGLLIFPLFSGAPVSAQEYPDSSCAASALWPGYFFDGSRYFYESTCATEYVPPTKKNSNCYSSSIHRGLFLSGITYYLDKSCTIKDTQWNISAIANKTTPKIKELLKQIADLQRQILDILNKR